MSALLRLTGRAALVAGGVHLLQFLVLGIGPALGESEYPTPAEAAGNFWFGLAGLATFALIGLAYLVFFSSATQLAWRDATGTTVVWRRAAQTAATVAITGWFLSGALNLARRGFNATGIAEAADGDDVLARTALASTYVILSTVVVAAAVCFAAWFVAFAVRSVRTSVFGVPTAVAVILFGAVVPLLGWVTNVGAIPTILVAFLVLGPVLMRRAKREAAVPALVGQ